MVRSSLNRLQVICRYARYIAIAVLVFLSLVLVLYAVAAVAAVLDPDAVIQGLSRDESTYQILMGLSGSVFLIALALLLVRITGSLSHGPTPFTGENVRILKWIAVVIFISQIFATVLGYLAAAYLDLDMTVNLPLGNLIISAVVYVIALIFEYGVGLQEDSDSIV